MVYIDTSLLAEHVLNIQKAKQLKNSLFCGVDKM